MADLTALQMVLGGLTQAADVRLVNYRGKWHTGGAILAGAESLASQMQQAGLGAGHCVWIIVTDNLSAMQMQIGAWLLGASSLMLDFRNTAHRFAQMRDKLPPDLVVSTRRVATAAALGPILLDPETPAVFGGTAQQDDLVADYFSTSGSTGLPKLTAVNQNRLGGLIQRSIDGGERGAWGAALSALSVAYPASRAVWWRNLAAGVPVICLDLLYNLSELDAALMDLEVQECTLPPSLIRRLAHMPSTKVPRYPQLKKLQSVGGPATPADKILALRQLSPNYLMTYSSTECGIISRLAGADVYERPASCGRPLPGIAVRIGQGGEVMVTRADGVIVDTGDLGWIDPDGFLFLTGRKQGLLCRNGVNFSADRIINAVLTLTEVIDAVVVALPAPDGGDEVHLIVETKMSDDVRVKTVLRQNVPAAEQPDQIHFRDRLPRAPSGKIDVPQLRDSLRAESWA